MEISNHYLFYDFVIFSTIYSTMYQMAGHNNNNNNTNVSIYLYIFFTLKKLNWVVLFMERSSDGINGLKQILFLWEEKPNLTSCCQCVSVINIF